MVGGSHLVLCQVHEKHALDNCGLFYCYTSFQCHFFVFLFFNQHQTVLDLKQSSYIVSLIPGIVYMRR